MMKTIDHQSRIHLHQDRSMRTQSRCLSRRCVTVCDNNRFSQVADQFGLEIPHSGRPEEGGLCHGGIDAVVGRGGLFKPIKSGTYVVNDAMIRDIIEAKTAACQQPGGMIAKRSAMNGHSRLHSGSCGRGRTGRYRQNIRLSEIPGSVFFMP